MSRPEEAWERSDDAEWERKKALAAPLPPLIRPGIQLFEKEWEHLQVWANNHAYAAIAAAQAHFDRTIAEFRSQAKLDSNYRTDLLAAEEKMAEMQAQFDRTLSYQAQEAGKKIMELTRLLREVSDADAAGNDLSRDLIYRIDDALRAEGSGNG
jgi:hypothetical protein